MKHPLVINTAADPAWIALADQVVELPNRRGLSESLLAEIDNLLRQADTDLDQLPGIAAVTGPGSFTGLRLGIATANALAWARQLRLAPLTLDEASNPAAASRQAARKLKFGDTVPAITPQYGRPPSITPPRESRKS